VTGRGGLLRLRFLGIDQRKKRASAAVTATEAKVYATSKAGKELMIIPHREF
jgi:hypothetical protein